MEACMFLHTWVLLTYSFTLIWYECTWDVICCATVTTLLRERCVLLSEWRFLQQLFWLLLSRGFQWLVLWNGLHTVSAWVAACLLSMRSRPPCAWCAWPQCAELASPCSAGIIVVECSCLNGGYFSNDRCFCQRGYGGPYCEVFVGEGK